MSEKRPRSTELGVEIGILPHGPHNSITDVPEVSVGHETLIYGEGPLKIGDGPVRTGVTAILPHRGNIFERKVIASVHVLNGFGKSVGFLQVNELGVIESPIVLTNTLNTWRVADAVIDYLAANNPYVNSFNPVVGECNDGFLNDIIGRHVNSDHVQQAISEATSPSIMEGNVGAGTGMTGFGWKGGIGTSSRLCDVDGQEYTVGAMTLTNTGDPRELRIDGIRIGRHLMPPADEFDPIGPGGSIMMVVATNAPVSSRQIGRIGRRASLGLARAGGIADHSSGDFIIMFTNSLDSSQLDDASLTPLMRGAVEATEEAVINSVLQAKTMTGRDGNTRRAIPIKKLKEILASHG